MGKKAGKKTPKAKNAKKTFDAKKIEKVVIKIISEAAEVDKKKIKPDTKFMEDLNMDSMMALEILAMIEKTYKVEISEETLPRMTSLREVMKVVKELMD